MKDATLADLQLATTIVCFTIIVAAWYVGDCIKVGVLP